MTLRDELAERLNQLWWESSHPGPISRLDSGKWSETMVEAFGRMADECVRQMEWARQGIRLVPDYEESDIVFPPITMAPPGWKP